MSSLATTIITVLARGSSAYRLSLATAYVSLILLAVTLLIGPIRALRGQRNPLSNDLRRDVGIWTAITALAHVATGLLVHMGGRPWLYFLRPFGELNGSGISGMWPFRTDSFGFTNDIGLVATIIVATLLLLSNDVAMGRLGARRWKSLQRMNYALLALVLLHGVIYQQLESQAVALIVLLVLTATAVGGLQAAGFGTTRMRAARRRTRAPA